MNQPDTQPISKTPLSVKLVTMRRGVIISLICLIIIVAAIAKLNRPAAKTNQASLQNSSSGKTADNRTTIQPAKVTISINKDFTFNITDNSGQAIGKVGYHLDSAELRNEIVVKGETATAVKGRIFLIINLKLKNDSKTPLTINTRNFIRLAVNDNTKEWLAPDIHNDPVEVQAISTKLTRVGFPISDTDKQLKLQVGEIDGNKTTLDLKF